MQILSDARPLVGSARLTETSLGARDHINPATGEPQAMVNISGAPEVDAALASAVAGQKAWMAYGPARRRDCLFKLAELVERETDWFNRAAALEVGTPLSVGGPGLALSWIRYYAGWADKVEGTITEPIGASGLAYAKHEPIGVIGVIIPWNSPLIAISMTAILALAGGNAVVLKPPTQTPFVALRFGELALEAGFPEGALNIVPGDAEAGEALIGDARCGKISFTGGEQVAKIVMRRAAEVLKPVALELGGKSANIIFDDADLDAAAHMAAMCSIVVATGQGCVLPTRAYVHDAVFDRFVDKVAAHAAAFPLGDPLDAKTLVGPVITEAAARRIMDVIDRAKSESGGTLVAGGARGEGDLARGAFVQPTVFADVAHDSHLAREEVFGPVLAILRFKDEAEVVAKANDSRFGLGGYIHTNDLKRAHRMAGALQAGAISVNGMLPMAPNLPFGGFKESGFGREGGKPGLEEFMQIKQVMIHL
ncbi:aldehyde dehydrogenase [Sphingopyxis sp. JAI128]|uniref:aldehyde dehydrogenase family protein n=1 Tax=Sphingopyxis sp. JAI128 TaxID=2723066 RepID=UPI00161252C2|nr:aldehyde dehydrogenase family protein [Sphingopyxis sp. JAI128]MBB6426842.1 aldehyde dehydrogenase (NAD+) [Sphingopyxis sp. JAI128]